MPHSPHVKFIQEWHQGFQTKDLDLLENSLHDDFRHYVHPHTITQPPLSKATYVGALRKVIPTWTHSKLTTHFIVEAPGKVITHVRIQSINSLSGILTSVTRQQLTNETKNNAGHRAPYESLLIASIVTDDDGCLKIKQIDEWLDSKVYTETEGFSK